MVKGAFWYVYDIGVASMEVVTSMAHANTAILENQLRAITLEVLITVFPCLQKALPQHHQAR